MRFLFTILFVINLGPVAYSQELSDIQVLYQKAGANKAGRCPNGAYINPGRNEDCSRSQLPPPSLVKELKASVGDALCDINQLIYTKRTLAYTLDQFYCAENGVQAAICAAGVAPATYAGIRMAKGGFGAPTDSPNLKKLMNKLDKQMPRLAEELVSKGKAAPEALWKEYISTSGKRAEVINQLRLLGEDVTDQTSKGAIAGKLAQNAGKLKAVFGATAIGAVMLYFTEIKGTGQSALSDRYKNFKGFLDFASLSDKQQCEQLALPENGLRNYFVGMSVKMQEQLSADLPIETVIKCGSREGHTLALFKNHDGTSSLRGYEFDFDGQIKSLSGYPLADAMDPKDDINFARAAKMDQTKEGTLNKDFQAEIKGSAVVFPDPATNKTDPHLAKKEKLAQQELRRMSMMAPAIFQSCNPDKSTSNSNGKRGNQNIESTK